MQLLDELIRRATQAFPNIVFALLIAIVGWIVAKIIARIVRKVLETLQVDRLADKLNDIEIVNKANFKILPSQVLSKLMYYLVLIVSFIAATDVLEIEAVSKLMSDFINYLPSLFSAVIFFIIGLLVADFAKGIVLTTCQSLGIPSAKVISSIVFYFLLLTVTMSALDQAKISTDLINSSFMIIIAGVVSSFALGYGLASKDMMANFLASFYVKNKFEAGDKITIDGIEGQIEAMDNKSFVLKTLDSKVVFPLSKLAQDKVEIHS